MEFRFNMSQIKLLNLCDEKTYNELYTILGDKTYSQDELFKKIKTLPKNKQEKIMEILKKVGDESEKRANYSKVSKWMSNAIIFLGILAIVLMFLLKDNKAYMYTAGAIGLIIVSVVMLINKRYRDKNHIDF